MNHTIRFARALSTILAGTSLVVPLACSAPTQGRAPASVNAGGLQVPGEPYPPFPYVSAVQRRSFHAYLDCAHGLGVNLEGPFADSHGHGALIRAVPGSAASSRDRAEVMRKCPEGVVAFALTPPTGSPSGRAFEHALVRFAGCVADHGVPQLPMPTFGSQDPYTSVAWPLDWHNHAVVEAARPCISPLQAFVLAG